MFRFPVHQLLVVVENVWGPGETKKQVRNKNTIGCIFVFFFICCSNLKQWYFKGTLIKDSTAVELKCIV